MERRGFDGCKKIDGRKRHIAVDTGGLLLAIMVTALGSRTVTRPCAC